MTAPPLQNACATDISRLEAASGVDLGTAQLDESSTDNAHSFCNWNGARNNDINFAVGFGVKRESEYDYGVAEPREGAYRILLPNSNIQAQLSKTWDLGGGTTAVAHCDLLDGSWWVASGNDFSGRISPERIAAGIDAVLSTRCH